jgi:SAM-dependent methyltransferase
MGFYSEHILPRCIDAALSRPPVMEARARVTAGLQGDVLELGFGSGLNLPYYPPEVRNIIAVDPSRLARKLARKRIAACAIPLRWLDTHSPRLPLPDASLDAVLTTFTLCTVPEVAETLRELRRVLRPCGKLHFLEHGRSPDARVHAWQERLTPVQRRIAGGCHLNRPIDDLVRAAGFCLDSLQTYYMEGPRPLAYMFEGRACACARDASKPC